MPTYPYVCVQTGETKDIVASIKNPPALVFKDETDGLTWHRVWECGPVVIQNPGKARAGRGSGNGLMATKQGGAVGYKGIPASRSLPRRKTKGGTLVNRYGQQVYEFPDGSMTDTKGRPIVDGQESRERELKRAGFQDDNSDPNEVANDTEPIT